MGAPILHTLAYPAHSLRPLLSIFHHYRRRRLKKKPLQCKTIIKIKEIRSEYLLFSQETWKKRVFKQISNPFLEHIRTYFISLSLQFHADAIPIKSLNYTIRNREISNKMLGTIVRTDSVWDREIFADNLLFILILNNFPEHVLTHILHRCLCNLMQKAFLSKVWSTLTLFGIDRFRTKC